MENEAMLKMIGTVALLMVSGEFPALAQAAGAGRVCILPPEC
jgi:hypothetical protein